MKNKKKYILTIIIIWCIVSALFVSYLIMTNRPMPSIPITINEEFAEYDCLKFGIISDTETPNLDVFDEYPHSAFKTFIDYTGKHNLSFIIDLGDTAIGQNQKEHLIYFINYTNDNSPHDAYFAIGNHELDYMNRTDWLEILGYGSSYYAFNIDDYRCYVLDGNIYSDVQYSWLANDLQNHSDKKKIVFSHQPLSDNLTFVELLKHDGNVIVCFSGHKDVNLKWNVGGICFVGLTHGWHYNFAVVVITEDALLVYGNNQQESYVVSFT